MKKSLAVLGKEAHERHDKILQLKKTMSVGFLLMGRELKSMKDNGYWKFITGEDMTWKDYCKEIDVNRDYADILIRIYDIFILKLKFKEEEIAPVDQRKLIALVGIVKERKDAEELLDKARHLTRSDLMLEIHQMKNPPSECEHDPKEVNYWYCKLCKEKLSPAEVKKYGK